MSHATSDAAVVVLILAAGLFSGVMAAKLSSHATHMPHRGTLIVAAGVLAAAFVAVVLWSVFGYGKIAGSGTWRGHRLATMSAAAGRSRARSSAAVGPSTPIRTVRQPADLPAATSVSSSPMRTLLPRSSS